MKFAIRKGQAATEYLMTYGWALLAIVIVAGVLWGMGLFGGSCASASKGFAGAKVTLDDWKVTDTEVLVTLKNAAGAQIDITDLQFATTNSSSVSDGTIASGGSGTVTGTLDSNLGINAGDCYTDQDLIITYTIAGGISHTTTGSISGGYE
ncbi:MAG: hypothetical protein KAJ47_01515 [Candidatus Aenigmarchaeota archaeon]|nr:hypothetical protein [Candidatus Aenigmarchaeota archaeon]